MNTYSPTYSDDDDEMGDIVEAYAEQEAADRPTDTDNARRRHLAEMTRQAFADGLYETSAADYAEALRRARAEPTTDIAEDAWEVIVRVRDDYPRVINDAPTEEIVEALADAGLLAAARTATIEDAEEVLHGAGWFARADLDPRDLRGILHDLADAGLFATARTVTTAHECDSGDFDRTICDCGAMHSYCTGCGTRQDGCPHGTTTATIEDVLDSLPYFTFEDDDVAPDEEFVRKADVARLLATARTRPTREQVTAAIGDAANSMQVGFGVVSITAAVDAVLALYADQPTRDDLARAIASGYEPDHPTPNRHDYRAADAVLALFNEKGD